jgi:hypothetical protein
MADYPDNIPSKAAARIVLFLKETGPSLNGVNNMD